MHEDITPARGALGIAAFSAATPLVMLVAAAGLDAGSGRAVALALLFSAGTFVYVATVDRLPSVHHPDQGRRAVLRVAAGAALFCVVLLVLDVMEHTH